MFPGLMLSAALVAGQAPAPARAPIPMAMPAMPTTVDPAPVPPDIVFHEHHLLTDKAEPEVAEEPPTYFLGNLFGSTPAGAWMKEKGISLYGWTEFSGNISSARRTNAPIFMYDQADKVVMNQNFLHLGKTVDASNSRFQLGGVVEMILPGTDARTTISRNLLDGQANNSPNWNYPEYPIDLFQAYGEAFLPNIGSKGTTVKVGKFATIIGYELVQAADTPFLGRSFLFQYNPFTHTGGLATTPLGDNFTMYNGITLGSDNFYGGPNAMAYLGGLRWEPKDGKSALQFSTQLTNPHMDVASQYAYYNVYNLLFTHDFNDKLSYVLDSMYSHTSNVPGIGYADWYGAAQYLFFQHNDQIKSGLRFELFNDTDGFRTGTSGLYTSATYGITYTPANWLMIRPSFQYVHNPSGAFEGHDDAYIGAMDFIVRW